MVSLLSSVFSAFPKAECMSYTLCFPFLTSNDLLPNTVIELSEIMEDLGWYEHIYTGAYLILQSRNYLSSKLTFMLESEDEWASVCYNERKISDQAIASSELLCTHIGCVCVCVCVHGESI